MVHWLWVMYKPVSVGDGPSFGSAGNLERYALISWNVFFIGGSALNGGTTGGKVAGTIEGTIEGTIGC